MPRTGQRDFIHIMKGTGCHSKVGKCGRKQEVSLGRGCVYTGIVIHELMHAVGFWHEQSRSDRDKFIEVVYRNIQDAMVYNFNKMKSYEINMMDVSCYGTPFSFRQINSLSLRPRTTPAL